MRKTSEISKRDSNGRNNSSLENKNIRVIQTLELELSGEKPNESPQEILGP